ncbi:ribosome-binding factor A [Abditibacterium utsteinense]|uniref:Ribosome-binding factor A n=1 Tax=Abditibacterium utsteinense TaxID=1960156 RepID=A0A2S8STB6_9BACT|nr:30S ribosome-binding factor RbfA [Abditibacterium utsteinense]PQV64041.1 ribosome-binding factor A [Abditibacterium utsteinense]
MATTFRADRAAEAIRMSISKALREDINDPTLQEVTITKVEVTHDLSYARLYFTVMGDDQIVARNEALAGFTRAMPFLRSRVGEEVPLRSVPELGFKYDKGIENAMRLEEIFAELPELRKD